MPNKTQQNTTAFMTDVAGQTSAMALVEGGRSLWTAGFATTGGVAAVASSSFLASGNASNVIMVVGAGLAGMGIAAAVQRWWPKKATHLKPEDARRLAQMCVNAITASREELLEELSRLLSLLRELAPRKLHVEFALILESAGSLVVPSHEFTTNPHPMAAGKIFGLFHRQEQGSVALHAVRTRNTEQWHAGDNGVYFVETGDDLRSIYSVPVRSLPTTLTDHPNADVVGVLSFVSAEDVFLTPSEIARLELLAAFAEVLLNRLFQDHNPIELRLFANG